MTLRRVAVIGLGLIGGSIAGAVRQTGTAVVGFDLEPANLVTATQRGLIDDEASSLALAVKDAELIVLAVPVLAVVDMLPSVDRLSKPEAVLIDTASVKGPVISAMAKLPGSSRAVGGHPIAGSERSGAEAADRDLFRGRTFVVVPGPTTCDAALRVTRKLVHALGAKYFMMDAPQHDRVVALTSHLPQVLSMALAGSLGDAETSLVGPALRDMTRLARSNDRMWTDILLTNRDNVVDALRTYMGELDGVISTVEAGERCGIQVMVEAAQRAAVSLAGASPT